jgi:translocation protein SEC62
VRVFVFAVVWIVFGRHFWVLPNITSDEIPIDEVFSPMWAFDDLDAGGNVVGKIPALNRLAAAGSAAAMLAALYAIAPEKGSAIKSINRAHGSILDLFDLYDTPKGLAGAAANATAAANASDCAGGAPAGNETAAAGGEAATAAGAADGRDIDPLEDDVAPPAPPPPYGGPEDGGAADAETKVEL